MKRIRQRLIPLFILALLGLSACNTDEESAVTENSETDGPTTISLGLTLP